MKKHNYIKIILIFFTAFFYISVKGQINYNFTPVGGAFTANAAPTVLHAASVDDAISAATSIGFTFQYGCTNYTQFKATSNGVMFLGAAAAGINASNDLAASSDRPGIAPLWDDLKTGTAGSVNYKLTGVAGSRILTVEWLNMLWYYSGTGSMISFQVKLYETSNRIEFIYRQEATAVYSGSPSASIGISGVTSGDYYSLSNVTAAPTASKVFETKTILSKPATGQVYTWDPVTCSGTPTAGTTTASATTVCSGVTTVLGLSGSTTGCGLTYQWQSSPNNIAWSNIVGATSSTYTATIAANTYYRCVITCAGSANSVSVLITMVGSPANDACASAVSLGTVSTTTTTTGDNTCATPDKASTCHSPTRNVWYSFTVPASGGTYSVSVNSGTQVDPCITVYSGACGGLTTVVCTYGGISSASVNASCLAPGTYYINVDDDIGTAGTFSLTVTQTSSVSASANDACASAISLGTVSTTTTTTGNNYCATADKASTCHSPTDNVWYTFTVPAGGGSYAVSVAAGTIINPCITVYSGACAGLTVKACTYGSSVNANCLAAGTYYIAVDDDFGTEGTFSLTVTQTISGATSPVNDACASAISLGTVSTTTTTTGNNTCATADKASTCHTPSENVWYTFTVPAGGGSYAVSITGGTITSPCLTVYSGACGGLVQKACTYNSTLNANCLAAGTYYINVDDDFGTTGTFSITVTQTSAGTSVPNDACASAISLGTVSTTTTTTGTNACATADKTSTCHSPTENVWYSFTVPAGGGSYAVSVAVGTMVSPCITVYSGACGGLTVVACTYGSGSSASVNANCLAAGTYYINVDDDFGTAGTFSVTVTQTISGAGPPANDNCAGAVTLTPGASCTQTVGNVACATQSQAGCLGTANDDVWYKFTAANTTQYINVTGSSSFDPVVQLFSGTCAGLVSVWCNDASYLTGVSGSAVATGLTIGNVYFIRVYDYGGSAPTTTTFSICVTNPPTCPASLGAGVVAVPSLPYSAAGNTTCGKGNDITSVNVTNICGSASYYGGEDVVYTFTPTVTGVVTIIQSNTSGTVGFMLYDNCPYTGNCVANAQNSDVSRTVCVTLTAGVTYYLVMDSYPSPNCYLFDVSISAPVVGTPPGTDCATADPITSLPYTKTGISTCCKLNDYTATDACTSIYMGGEDYVFSYTPAANISIDITLSNTLSGTGLFITQGCPNVGTCVNSATSASGNPSICNVALTGGVTYYIIVDTDPSPACTPFDININQTGTLTSCNLAYTAATMVFSSADPLTTGAILSFPDDHFANSYTPIGFNFCFDGIQYSQLLVSSNAYLIFDPFNCITNLPTSNATPGGFSAWSISGAIPNTTNAPRNAILGPWHDIDPGVAGNVRYQTYGVSPNRRFVVSYENVAMFSCNSVLFDGQIKIYETSNNIEVHLAAKNLCTSWNTGQAILGLHNYNGTLAVVPSGGYNAPTQWTAANLAWQFTTSCATCAIVLATDIIAFTGKKQSDNANLIKWETASEKNTKQFILEKSLDGILFAPISTIPAKNKNAGSSYSFTDFLPDKNLTYYYRLTSQDFNGQTKTTGIVVVQRNQYLFNATSLYPNPASNSVTLETEVNAPGTVKINIYDLVGKLAGEQSVELVNGFNAIEITLEKLAGGMYYIKVIDPSDHDKTLFVQKIVKE